MNNEKLIVGDGAVSSGMVAYWYTSPVPHAAPAVDLILPMNGSIRHNAFHKVDSGGVRRVEVGSLRVSPGLRGNGMGEQLAQGLGALARKYDFNQIYACIASQYSLDILGKVFGGDNMAFFGRDGSFIDLNTVTGFEDPEPVEELDIGSEHARKVLVKLEKAESDPELRVLGFPVTVDLEGLDMSGWELPVEFGGRAVSTD